MLITTTRNENLILYEEIYSGEWMNGIIFLNENN